VFHPNVSINMENTWRPEWSTAITETLFTKLAPVKLFPWRPARTRCSVTVHSVTRGRTQAHSFIESRMPDSRSRWLRGLRRVSAATNLLGLRFEPRREHGCLYCTVRTEDRKPGQTSMDGVQSTTEYKKKKISPEAWLCFVFYVWCKECPLRWADLLSRGVILGLSVSTPIVG
jgi:hypothetical protein